VPKGARRGPFLVERASKTIGETRLYVTKNKTKEKGPIGPFSLQPSDLPFSLEMLDRESRLLTGPCDTGDSPRGKPNLLRSVHPHGVSDGSN
jgi:hypothetical protein